MTNRLFALALALLFTFALSAPASAATPKAAAADWSAVQSLSPGDKVRVSTKDGDRLKGRFESANETDINFTHDGRTVTLKRDSIKSVEIGHKNRLEGRAPRRGRRRRRGRGLGHVPALAHRPSDHERPSPRVSSSARARARPSARPSASAPDYRTVYEAQ